jgi:hypothetical protein
LSGVNENANGFDTKTKGRSLQHQPQGKTPKQKADQLGPSSGWTEGNQRPMKHTERWFVKADGTGTYEARFEMIDNGVVTGGGAALSGQTLDAAVAHCAMAIRTGAERDEKSELIDGLLDPTNWKLPTKRIECQTQVAATAIADALGYFCGGAEISPTPGGGFTVGSLGYYHYVGA